MKDKVTLEMLKAAAERIGARRRLLTEQMLAEQMLDAKKLEANDSLQLPVGTENQDVAEKQYANKTQHASDDFVTQTFSYLQKDGKDNEEADGRLAKLQKLLQAFKDEHGDKFDFEPIKNESGKVVGYLVSMHPSISEKFNSTMSEKGFQFQKVPPEVAKLMKGDKHEEKAPLIPKPPKPDPSNCKRPEDAAGKNPHNLSPEQIPCKL